MGRTLTLTHDVEPDVHVTLDTPGGPRPPGPPWLPFALVAALALGAVVVFVSATKSAPPAVAERHEAPERAPAALTSLAWEQVATLETTRLLGVGDVDGQLWAFGEPAEADGGLLAWSQNRAGDWVSRGEVIGPALRLDTLTVGADRLVGAGVDVVPYRVFPEPFSPTIQVVESDNGVEWFTTRLVPPVNGARPVGTAVTDEFALVVARVGQVILPTMLEALGPDWHAVLANHAATTYLEVGDTWVRAYGPAGLVLEEWPVVSLGVTGATSTTDVVAWRSDTFGEWQPVPGFPLESVESLVTSGDGRVVATGGLGGEVATFVTSDGRNWTAVEPRPFQTRVVSWGNRVLALADIYPEVYELNATLWRRIPMARILPTGTYGDVVGAAGGEAGFFALLGGPEWKTSRHGEGAVSVDGTSFVIAERGTSMAIIDDSGVRYQFSSRLQQGQVPVEFDPASASLTIGVEGVGFVATLDAFTPMSPGPIAPEARAGVGGHFIVSPDGESWAAVSAANFGDPQSVPVPVYVGPEAVVAAGQPADAPAVTDRFGRAVEVLAPVELWAGRPR